MQLTRNLLARGKGIYFELDNINTLEQERELRLTIMASLAQDESRRISKRLKFGFNRAIESIWGYEKNKCKLELNEKEANMVKRVFEMYSTRNIGIRKIGKELAKEGILSRKGTPLCYSTLGRILKNSKYKGFYCGKKTEVIDFLTKESVEIPSEEWVSYKTTENVVPQIVQDNIWERCNEIKNKRSSKYTVIGDRWNNLYQYSNILICMNDGKTFWRRKHSPSAKEEFWICSEYAKNGMKNCNNNIYIGTGELNQILQEVFTEMLENKNKIIKEMLKINDKVIEEFKRNSMNVESIQEELAELENHKKNLIKLYSLNKIDEDEFEEFHNEYKSKIMECKGKMIDIQNNRQAREIEKMQKKINKIYVERIGKDHVRLKINFHLDLEMSEVDKKSICLGLII